MATELSDAHKPGRPDEAERIARALGWVTEEKELYMGRLHRMDLSDPLVRDKAQQVSWVTINRVCGELAVSRSIGDPDYKGFVPGEKVDALFNWPEGHSQVFMADLVIPTPETRSMDIASSDEFIILASDGLWGMKTHTHTPTHTHTHTHSHAFHTRNARKQGDVVSMHNLYISLFLISRATHTYSLTLTIADVISGAEAVTRVRAAFVKEQSPTEAAEELCDLALKLGSSDNVTIVIVQFSHT